MGDNLIASPARSRFAGLLGMKDAGSSLSPSAPLSHSPSPGKVGNGNDAQQAPSRAGTNPNVFVNDVRQNIGEQLTVDPRSYSYLEDILKHLTYRGEHQEEPEYNDRIRTLARRFATRLEDNGIPEEDRVDCLREDIKEALMSQLPTSTTISLSPRIELDQAVLEVMHAHRQDLQGGESIHKPRPLSRTSSNRSLNTRTTPSSPLMKSTLLPNIRRGSTVKTLPAFRPGISNVNVSLANSLSRPSSAADSRPGTPTTPLGSPARLSAAAMEFRPGGPAGPPAMATAFVLTPSLSSSSSPSKKATVADTLQWDRLPTDVKLQPNSLSGKASILADDIATPDLFADPDDMTDIFDAFDPFSSNGFEGDRNNMMNQGEGADEVEGDLSPLELLKAVVAGLPPEIAEPGIFGDHDYEQALLCTNHDVEAALELLLRNEEIDTAISDFESTFAIPNGNLRPAMGDAATSEASGDPSKKASSSRSTKICRHFLQGECRRSDCRFSHELNIVCRFWVQGRCTKSDCTFLHSMDGQIVTSDAEDGSLSDTNISSRDQPTRAKTVKSPQGKLEETEAFPGLPVATSQVSTPPDIASRSVLKINNAASGEGFAGVARRAASGNVRSRDRPQTPPNGKVIGPAYAATSPRALTPSGDASDKDSTSAPRRNLQPRFPLRAPTSIPHLTTGSELNSSYMRKRSRAAEHARHRNVCLQRAAEAFRRGDSAAAKKWSIEGREADQKMLASHREAAWEIFESRNKNLSTRSGKGEAWIDLHGLHAAEAIELLESWLERLDQENHFAAVYVVVGKAGHSNNSGGSQHTGGSGRGKLGKEVVAWLQQWGYPFREFHVGSSGGVIAVDAGVHL